MESHGPTVGKIESGLAKFLDKFQIEIGRLAEINFWNERLQLPDLIRGNRRSRCTEAFPFPAGHENGAEFVVGDGSAAGANEKAVEQCAQGFVFGQIVAGPDKHERRELVALTTTPESAFVECGEEVVEDGAVGVEELIQENNLGFGEHAFGVGDQFAFLEPADVEGAKKFVGLGESGEKIVEGFPDDPLGDGVNEGTLCRSRRAVEEEVFAGDQSDAEEIHNFIFADELLFYGVEQFFFEAGNESELGFSHEV